MNAREVLAEVQKVPGYAEGKPDYGAMLKVFGERRRDISRVISGFEMRMRDPLDTIDSYVATAESALAGANSETLRKKYQRMASLYFKSSYDSEMSGLDFYNKQQENQVRTIQGFQRDYKPQDAFARQQEARRVTFVEGIKEVKAIKELAQLYTEAQLAVKQMTFLLK